MGPFASGNRSHDAHHLNHPNAPTHQLMGSHAPPAPMRIHPAAPPPQQHPEYSGPFMRPADHGRMEAPPPGDNYRGPLGAGLLQSLIRDTGERYGGGGSSTSVGSSTSHSFSGCPPRPPLRPKPPGRLH